MSFICLTSVHRDVVLARREHHDAVLVDGGDVHELLTYYHYVRIVP